MQMRTTLQAGSESEEDRDREGNPGGEAVEAKVALYNDCIAAMAFLLDKERGFHRVRHAVARCESSPGHGRHLHWWHLCGDKVCAELMSAGYHITGRHGWHMRHCLSSAESRRTCETIEIPVT